MKMVWFYTYLLIALTIPTVNATEETYISKTALKIYLDCECCDYDFIREEIPFVNYVIERQYADIHILVTTQATASGGRECTSVFIGQDQFAGKNDTLMFYTQQSDSDDDFRNRIIKSLKIGLVSYIGRTPFAEHLSIEYEGAEEPTIRQDPWNHWLFQLGVGGDISGEKSTKNNALEMGLAMRRITENWKFRSSVFLNQEESRYSFEDENIYSISKRRSISALIVKSISEHWSVGMSNRNYASSYENIERSINISPAVEFNVFPYSESTRKELRMNYRFGHAYNRYQEETIYNKIEEHLWEQSLEITLELRQPWGTIEAHAVGAQYLHDVNKSHADVGIEISLRLFKGLAFFISGSASRIHDQINLPKRDATLEEVLLQRRELESQYSYSTAAGLEFTFGSIYNNIVNPRFGDD